MQGSFDPVTKIFRPLTEKEEERKKARKLSHDLRSILSQMRAISLEDLRDETLCLLYDNTVRLPPFIEAFNRKAGAILKEREQKTLEKINNF